MLWEMQPFFFISMLQKHIDRRSYVGTHRIKRDKFTTKDKQNLLKLWCYFYRKIWKIEREKNKPSYHLPKAKDC